MSNFLNNFSEENYKKNNSDDTKSQYMDDKSEKEITLRKDKKNLIELKGNAFEEERIEIDTSHNQFVLKRTAIICATVIICLLLILGVYVYSNQTVSINFVGKTETEAINWLEKNNVNYDITEIESTDATEGIILSQSIAVGEKIRPMELQTLEVSKGPNMTEIVPLSELNGKSKEEIKKFVDEKAIVNSTFKNEYSDTISADNLIRVEFEDDSVSQKNYTREDKVTFIISKGAKSEKKTLKVDNFVNETTDKVYEWVGDSGVMIDENQVASEKPEGYIVSQSLKAGDMVGYGDVLSIDVSKGSGEIVPYLVGYTLDEAQTIADGINLTTEPSEIYSDSESGIVVSQSLESDSVFFPDEDTMKIKISLGQPFISDMTGATVGDFVMTIQELNKQGANLFYTTTYSEITDKEKEEGIVSGTIKNQSISNEFVPIGSTINIEVYE